jgi:hypothetical protein
MKQPIAGIAGLKPRAAAPKPDGKLSKQEAHMLDAEYRRARNETLKLKNSREVMLQAKACGELIERKLVQTQAAFLLVAMRRAALALPQALCDRLAGIADPLEAKAVLDGAVRGLLNEVADLPNCVDPAAWARFLAEQTADNGAAAVAEERPAQGKPPRRRPK